MAVIALVVSILAFIAAAASAVYTRANAVAAKGVHEIEQARRLEERRPPLSGKVEQASAARTAWSAQDSLGVLTCRWSTAIWCHKMRISASLARSGRGARYLPSGTVHHRTL